MSGQSTREKRQFKNLASSKEFHSTVRAIAGLEGTEMNEVCDKLLLPVAEKRLAKLKGNGSGK